MIREFTEIVVPDGPVYAGEDFGTNFLVFRNGQLVPTREYTFYTETRLVQFHDNLQVGDTVEIVGA